MEKPASVCSARSPPQRSLNSRYSLQMTRELIPPQDLAGVFAVPPLPRRRGPRRTLDFDAAEAVAKHIQDGGITRYLYGGNAFLYHITLDEYETLLGWLDGFDASRWPIPSVGPSFGRAIDQAKLLKRYSFRAAMVLPCNDPRDSRGMEAGLREIADACGLPLILYLKSEDGFGSDKEAGLDAVGRLMHDGVAAAVKYAVVLDEPRRDPYLEGLLRRVDRTRVISGMGERPAIVHMRDFALPGFTTGSGCIASRACSRLFDACVRPDWAGAEELRAQFMPLEDLRDAWGPARVLHHATELAGIAPTGAIPPYVSPLNEPQLRELAPVARALREHDSITMQPQSR
jgi:dihydrodipicolinate synthase/N-acetylneuraminate lyase